MIKTLYISIQTNVNSYTLKTRIWKHQIVFALLRFPRIIIEVGNCLRMTVGTSVFRNFIQPSTFSFFWTWTWAKFPSSGEYNSIPVCSSFFSLLRGVRLWSGGYPLTSSDRNCPFLNGYDNIMSLRIAHYLVANQHEGPKRVPSSTS